MTNTSCGIKWVSQIQFKVMRATTFGSVKRWTVIGQSRIGILLQLENCLTEKSVLNAPEIQAFFNIFFFYFVFREKEKRENIK